MDGEVVMNQPDCVIQVRYIVVHVCFRRVAANFESVWTWQLRPRWAGG